MDRREGEEDGVSGALDVTVGVCSTAEDDVSSCMKRELVAGMLCREKDEVRKKEGETNREEESMKGEEILRMVEREGVATADVTADVTAGVSIVEDTEIDSEMDTLGVAMRTVVVVSIVSGRELEEMAALDCVGVGARMATEEEISRVSVEINSVVTVTPGLRREDMAKDDVI